MIEYNDMIMACGAVSIGLIVWLMLYLSYEFYILTGEDEQKVNQWAESHPQIDDAFQVVQAGFNLLASMLQTYEAGKVFADEITKAPSRRKNRDRMTK